MPQAVVVKSSDDTMNASDDAYASFTEVGTSANVSWFTHRVHVSDAGGQDLQVRVLASEVPVDAKAMIRKPHTRTRRRNATVKEQLDKTEVAKMLEGQVEWKLLVAVDDTTTEVLTRRTLEEAWETDATGVVTTRLRPPDPDEQAAIEAAKEHLTPKAGLDRAKTLIGSPMANVSLLALAAVGFIGLKTSDRDATNVFTLLAVGLSLASVGSGLVLGVASKRVAVKLSRLDLLQGTSLGPPPWLVVLPTALFVLALVSAVIALFVGLSSQPAPEASFGKLESTTAPGAKRKATFTVSWTNLGKSTTSVATVATAPGVRVVKNIEPTKGATTQNMEVSVGDPAEIEVVTRPLGADGKPTEDGKTHTYQVP